CAGIDVLVHVTDSFANYFWSSAQNSQSISVSASGNYNVLVFDSNGCNNTKSFEVVIDTIPFLNLGNDTAICSLDSLVLHAPDFMAAYAWSTTDSSKNITVFNAGTFSVTVTDSLGCVKADS